MASRTAVSGMVASAGAPAAFAKYAQAQRPARTPSGSPISSATTAKALASQATTPRTWDLANPRVLSSARSLRRRYTPVSSTCASVPTAKTMRTAASTSGVSLTLA